MSLMAKESAAESPSKSERQTHIVAITGPTAGGKTAVSLLLAERWNAEIVCCDSMQIYRHLDIGTAKPTPDERSRIVHHMLDIREPGERYSLAQYLEEVKPVFSDIHKRGKNIILVGGTVLYLSALVEGLCLSETAHDPKLRASIEKLLQSEGNARLHAELAAVDPVYAQKIHPNNGKRLVRALEEWQLSGGLTRSERDALSRRQSSPYRWSVFSLSHERAILAERISQRVEKMLADGLLDECHYLASLHLAENQSCMQAIGYKELFPYLRGESTLDEALAELLAHTRQYAKRQETWLRGKVWANWLMNLEANEACEIIWRKICAAKPA